MLQSIGSNPMGFLGYRGGIAGVTGTSPTGISFFPWLLSDISLNTSVALCKHRLTLE